MNFIKNFLNTLFSDFHDKIDGLESTIKSLEEKIENLSTSIPSKVESTVTEEVDTRIKQASGASDASLFGQEKPLGE